MQDQMTKKAPKKLVKPAREEQSLERERLVTYANETPGGTTGPDVTSISGFSSY